MYRKILAKRFENTDIMASNNVLRITIRKSSADFEFLQKQECYAYRKKIVSDLLLTVLLETALVDDLPEL